MSRASWYRHGKPTENPLTRLMTGIHKNLARAEVASQMRRSMSPRTHQRIERIARLDPEMALAVIAGQIKPGVAEKLLLRRPWLVTSSGTVITPNIPCSEIWPIAGQKATHNGSPRPSVERAKVDHVPATQEQA